MARAKTDNPLLTEWDGPFGAPPFAAIRTEHYRPAFDAGMAEQNTAIAAIAESKAAPSFENTIVALETSGRTLERVSSVFFNLTGADTNDDLQTVEREIAPVLARHSSAIFLNGALFARIDALWKKREALGLDAEQMRVLERYHTIFSREGAGLSAEPKARLAAIAERMAELTTKFGQNVLADEKAWTLPLESEADLAGMPDWLRAAAAQAATDRKAGAKHAVTLSRSIIEPFLVTSTRRDLREKAFEAWVRRGENGGTTDNRAIISEILALRDEQARILGYPTYAEFRLADTMAKTPGGVRALLDEVWVAGRARAMREAEALQGLIAEEGGNHKLAPWDWRHYAEKQRKRKFEFDEDELKPYLQLDNMIAASFDTASRLFGLRFTERHDVPAYHPDVRVWEVTNEAGKHVGLFLGDYFARPSKRSGAWMSSYRDQNRIGGAEVRPIIVNVMSFNKSPPGEPVLLSFDDARTLFHEFGHALHGLLSNVTYPLLWGTNVTRDFVELPSQLYEHWLERPEVLSRFARHAETGAPMPDALLKKVLAARTFNQGFATVEYTSSALVDLDVHLKGTVPDVVAEEKAELTRIGMPDAIAMRHRTPHFQHIFAGEGYSAGYYGYLWSEVLDADAFEAFVEAGDVFDPAVAQRLRDFIYAAGNRQDAAEAYKAFRGRMPTTAALLKKRGLDGSE
jgi:peptidyl-dipeptidase Dcp